MQKRKHKNDRKKSVNHLYTKDKVYNKLFRAKNKQLIRNGNFDALLFSTKEIYGQLWWKFPKSL